MFIVLYFDHCIFFLFNLVLSNYVTMILCAYIYLGLVLSLTKHFDIKLMTNFMNKVLIYCWKIN